MECTRHGNLCKTRVLAFFIHQDVPCFIKSHHCRIFEEERALFSYAPWFFLVQWRKTLVTDLVVWGGRSGASVRAPSCPYALRPSRWIFAERKLCRTNTIGFGQLSRSSSYNRTNQYVLLADNETGDIHRGPYCEVDQLCKPRKWENQSLKIVSRIEVSQLYQIINEEFDNILYYNVILFFK